MHPDLVSVLAAGLKARRPLHYGRFRVCPQLPISPGPDASPPNVDGRCASDRPTAQIGPLSPPLSAWQLQPDLGYDCSGKWSSHDPTHQQSALPFLNVCCVGSVSA